MSRIHGTRRWGSTGRVLATALLAGTLTLGAGCQSKRPSADAGAGTGAGAAATPTSADDLYRAKRYTEAGARAELDYARGDGEAKRRAALLAGMSSHACGRASDARRWLEPLLNDPAPEVSGRAAATLGLIAQEQKDPAQAAALLSRAAQQLTGDDAARAGLRAGHAQTELNQFAQARKSYEAAYAAATTPALKDAIRPYTEPGPFAIQVGVFSSRPNADRRAQEIQPKAAQLGLSPTRVRAKTGGKGGFAVQVGQFLNRHAAVLAGGKLGTQAVVVQAGE